MLGAYLGSWPQCFQERRKPWCREGSLHNRQCSGSGAVAPVRTFLPQAGRRDGTSQQRHRDVWLGVTKPWTRSWRESHSAFLEHEFAGTCVPPQAPNVPGFGSPVTPQRWSLPRGAWCMSGWGLGWPLALSRNCALATMGTV